MAQITGKVIKILDVVEGETARGAWMKGGFVILSNGDPQRVVAFSGFGEQKVAIISQLAVGQSVIVDYYPESREVGDRFFTECHMVRVSVAQKIKLEE